MGCCRALAGLSLFAEQQDSRGVAIAPDAQSMSRAIVDALVERSAEVLLAAACDHDGHSWAELGRYLLRAARTSGERSLVDFSVRLDRPVIGLGAPAPAYYPAVAARLGTRAVVPEHAGVANAVGAVVGGIRVQAAGTIARPDDGLYRVFAGASPRDFPDLEAATAYARRMLEAQARQRMRSMPVPERWICRSSSATTSRSWRDARRWWSARSSRWCRAGRASPPVELRRRFPGGGSAPPLTLADESRTGEDDASFSEFRVPVTPFPPLVGNFSSGPVSATPGWGLSPRT